MPTSVVDLRPNRRLLDYDFEGYKLNLQALPHWKYELPKSVDKVYPDDVQYSFVHAKLFALHNHLCPDYWDHRYAFYFIDSNQQVQQIAFDSDTHTFSSSIVYDIPAHVERKPGHFNLTLSFPTINLAVISDGTGYIHIVSTEGRTISDRIWKTVHSSLVFEEPITFIILDSHIQEDTDKIIIHCLLQSIEHIDEHFYSILTWVIYEDDGNYWKIRTKKQLKGKGSIHYAALEANFKAVYIASDNPFKYIFDSETDVEKEEPFKDQLRNFIYTWLQTMDDITITLKLPANFDKKLFNVSVSPVSIKVKYAGKICLDGKLQQKVDSELTTWNVNESGQVDILITKSESVLWNDFIEGGDPNGEQIMDASLVEEAHRRLSHLCSENEVIVDQSVPGFSSQELEECDAASEEDTVLVRLDSTNHEVTHRIPLSVHQYIFNVKLETREVPALVLRHDVDACIWQPFPKLLDNDTWPINHQGTLRAFGYVQSSKQNRKFVTCSPNFSYSVVCESSRHIFIYRNGDNANKLRKRSPVGFTNNIKIGQQHVFNIDKYGEVLGINATNNYLFVLTSSKVLALELI